MIREKLPELGERALVAEQEAGELPAVDAPEGTLEHSQRPDRRDIAAGLPRRI